MEERAKAERKKAELAEYRGLSLEEKRLRIRQKLEAEQKAKREAAEATLGGQMEKVAEHINEMQRIHEEYGAIFDHLFRQHQKALKSVRSLLSTTSSV